MSDLLTVDGDFDAAAARDLRPRIEQLAQAAGDVVVDLSSVEFIDSSGVGALVYLHKRLIAAGHRLKVVGLKGQPLELLTYLRLADQLV